MHCRRASLSLFCISLIAFVLFSASAQAEPAARWHKGNTHTHTWWSDGNSPPEVAVKWYKDHGYQFLMLSDHNVLDEGEKWVDPYAPNRYASGRSEAAALYEKEFPADSIQKRTRDGKVEYRLKTYSELQRSFEEPGKFILLKGEEISDQFEKKPIHLGAVNLKELIPPQGGKSVTDVMQRNIDAVLAQRKATGQPMFPHINHPNFGWALTPEDMAPVRGEQFFEVFNGHHGVRNWGDENHPSTDKIWDVVLARRLGDLHLPVMYGMATDDAHGYTTWGVGNANPGRGWVMVKAEEPAPAAIITAMEKGDFYASTGVTLKNVRFENNTLTVEIAAEAGATYRTEFIGTPRNFDRAVSTRPASDGYVIYNYSKDIGRVLDTQTGPSASYKLTGDELYVRAKITSSLKIANPFAAGDCQMAWTQPVTPQ